MATETGIKRFLSLFNPAHGRRREQHQAPGPGSRGVSGERVREIALYVVIGAGALSGLAVMTLPESTGSWVVQILLLIALGAAIPLCLQWFRERNERR
jgi:hypothetical protein